MKNSRSLFLLSAVVLSVLLLNACSARGLHNKYSSATEQRLVTQSIDKLVRSLPEKDFMPLKEKSVFVKCHFIEATQPLEYIKSRIELELMEKYGCIISTDPDDAFRQLHVFINAMGSDRDDFGLKTPEFVIPGVSGTLTINIITLDMYHGVSELYYYIFDPDTMTAARGERIKAVVRTDKLSLPIISIPINTLD